MDEPQVALRRLVFDDWRAVHTWAAMPETCRFQPWGPNTEEQTQAFVRAAVEAWSVRPQSRFAYIASLDGEPVGMGELRVRSMANRQGEISYVVHPRMWGRGVGTAIGRGLLSAGFEQLALHRIYATCDPRNLASGRVLRKLGMAFEGRHRETTLIRDGWRDSEVYSILERSG